MVAKNGKLRFSGSQVLRPPMTRKYRRLRQDTIIHHQRPKRKCTTKTVKVVWKTGVDRPIQADRKFSKILLLISITLAQPCKLETSMSWDYLLMLNWLLWNNCASSKDIVYKSFEALTAHNTTPSYMRSVQSETMYFQMPIRYHLCQWLLFRTV